MVIENNTFDPVRLSLEENAFLLDHLGEHPQVALDKFPNGPGMTPAAVKVVLETIYELNELESRRGDKWIGVDAIKSSIKTYLREYAKWESDAKRFPRAPRFPSLHSFDGKGRAHRGGPGSDSGQVRTYFDSKGERIPFAVNLLEAAEHGGWTPEWLANKEPINTKNITHDEVNRRFECPICKHTESYKADSKVSLNAARARLSKHLRTETKEQDLHRELYTNEFGS